MMKPIRHSILSIALVLASFLPVVADEPAPEQEFELLVLSEIEERIAGRMAFHTVQETLEDRGYALVSDPKIAAIGRTLATYSDRPHLHYAFYVIEGDLEPQALSLPGGYVLVSRSLLDTVCQTDDEIAFILGHEISHAALRHYADYKLEGKQEAAYIKRLIQTQDPRTDRGTPHAANALHKVLFPYLMKIRKMKEIEADQFGALYALRAGYRFSASMQVLTRLRTLYGEEFQLEKGIVPAEEALPSTPTTHPTLSERIQQLELFRLKAVEVSNLFPQGRDALDRGSAQEASIIFETILSLFPQSRAARIGLGVAYHLEYWDSSPPEDFLLAYPGSLEIEHLPLLRGTPDLQALHRAMTEYREVLALEPGNKYAANNLGVALAEFQRWEEAEAMLREALRLDTQDFTLFNLALVLRQRYRETQQPALRREAMTLIQDYLRLTPQDQVARQYLEELEYAHHQ
ncbi:M48 family metalloprotease [candidate division KSB3 bacterium]|uniref:M48 family metalloprotease n=1 Tax=candidate division KSB3 bacterium TaxID=2044937 RepID=A0A9D5Q7T7_9BACT|nr:M48 family metalloprotease [candidate division KSB3 bacterium]MBD3327240.1 M48 family metalloprotease [candidate division KSB3 bacterium]